MSRQDDPYAAGQGPAPYQRRASAQHVAVRDQAPLRIAAAQSSAYPSKAEPGGIADLIWYGTCALLGLACVGTLGIWLWRFINGQVNSTKLTILVLVVLIYALCAGCGWLWARARSAPIEEALQKQATSLQGQVEGLQQQVEYLTRENMNLQQTIRQQSNSPRTDPSQSAITARRAQASAAPLPPIAAPIPAPAPVIPDTSIYEQQREPDDASDLTLHPHEKRFPAANEPNVLDYNWRVIGASRRGYGHGYEGKYREDDFQIKILNNQAVGPALALVAIADGVSSKGLSRKGALASVEGASAITEQQVAPLKTLLFRNSSQDEIRNAAANILLEALHGAADAVTRAARTARVSIDDLHATLLVFLAVPLGPEQVFLASVQVGDGAIFGVRAGSNGGEPPYARWKQLLAPQIQAAGNEVQPFMRSQERDWYQYMQFDTLSPIAGIMAMTDGIADDVEPPLPTPGTPEPDHFSMVDRFYQTYVLPTLQASRPADELVRFIGYRRSQSIDDRTLVYLYHK
ncbi:MAG TPA: protein phosphatase 2C domain-containing protein [Ktedonobacteraceae bacterium]